MTRFTWAELSRGSVRTSAWVAGAATFAGIPAALLWMVVAPRAEWVRNAGGGYLKDGNTEAFAAADGWFFFLAIALGALSGALAARFVRRHGPLVTVALFVGCAAGALVAATLGHFLTLPPFAATSFTKADGQSLDFYLTLRAKAAMLAWPLGAGISLLLYTMWRWPRETRPPVVPEAPFTDDRDYYAADVPSAAPAE